MPNPFARIFDPLGFSFALIGHLVAREHARAHLPPDPAGRQGAAVPIRNRR
jgi:hypothetical protein